MRPLLAGQPRVPGGPEASVEVGVAGAPFDDWILYHLMMSMFANGNPGNDGEITVPVAAPGGFPPQP